MEETTKKNQVALVTGSARRIGAEIVRYLHGVGFDVVIHCHESLTCAVSLRDELNAKRPSSACVWKANLSFESEARELVQHSLSWKGRLDLLVNNASLFIKGSADTRLFDELLTLNLKAPLWLSDEAFSALNAHRGCIINITDIHADKPLKGYELYCQTKAALAMQTQALARAYAPGVRVNAVAPGAILWPAEGLSDAVKQQIIQETPLKCHGNPTWIAAAVYALADNPFITGQTLRVDGGRSLA